MASTPVFDIASDIVGSRRKKAVKALRYMRSRLLLLLLLVALVSGCASRTDGEADSADGETGFTGSWPTISLVGDEIRPQFLQAGDTPPDLQVSGTGYGFTSLSELKGKRVFITFWATWCPYCRQALPEYDKLRQELADEDIYWLFVDHHQIENGPITDEEIKEYVDELGLTTPIAVDRSGEVAFAFGVHGVPNSIILDADGKVALIIPGAMPYETAKLALELAADPSQLLPNN